MRYPLRTSHGLGLAVLLLAATSGEAATVKKINAVKHLVILDQGTNDGFDKKKKVCFFENEQSKDKLACGKIKAAKGKASSVFVKKDEDLAKIKVGMFADIEAINNKNVKITIDENADKPVEEGYKAPIYVGLFGGFAIAAPVSYNNLVYETPLGKDTETMWSKDTPVKATSFGAELGIGLGQFTLALGGRSRSFAPKRVSSDYADKDNDTVFEDYTESTGTGKGVGGWLDFYFVHWDFDLASFNMALGVDVDNSTVKFQLDKLSDTDNTTTRLYDVTSKLSVFSLRVPLILDFKFGSVGFRMGTVIFAPLKQKEQLTVVQSDPFTDQYLKGKTPDEDLKENLDHKAKAGAELTFMGYFAF